MDDRELRDQLYAFDAIFRLEADLIRCEDCGRACVCTLADEDFHHAASCTHADHQIKKPWRFLAALLRNIKIDGDRT